MTKSWPKVGISRTRQICTREIFDKAAAALLPCMTKQSAVHDRQAAVHDDDSDFVFEKNAADSASIFGAAHVVLES